MKIEVKDEYIELLEKRAQEKNFKDAEEYINFVLSQIISKIKDSEKNNQQKSSNSKEDEEKVKQRLRNLGYID